MLIPAAAGIRRRHGISLGQMALKGEALIRLIFPELHDIIKKNKKRGP